MSSVAEILQSLADVSGQAALRKGAIYGGIVSGVSQIPAQISAEKERQAALQLHTSQVQQQMDLERSRGAREDQQAAHGQAADALAAKHKAVVDAAFAAGIQAHGNPTGPFDAMAAYKTATNMGDPSAVSDAIAKHRASVSPLTEHDTTKALRDETGATVVPAVPKPDPVTAAQLDARQQFLLSKKAQKIALTPAEEAEVTAYDERKRTVSDPAATAAAERQATSIAASNDRATAASNTQAAQQKRAQDFAALQAARADLEKNVNTPYNTAKTSANTLRDVVEAAKNGNAVAGSLQSLEATMAAIRAQGLNRINTAEIGATAGAGNLWNNIQGWFGKKAAGQPVPPAVQKDMLEFADILEKAAYKKYQSGHAATNKLYGTSIPELLTGPDAPASGAPSGASGIKSITEIK